MGTSGLEMGEITYIKDGIATTIHDDGSTSSRPMDQCDSCGEWVSTYGGFNVRDVAREVVIWLCAACRA
jgi:hypothetical protein